MNKVNSKATLRWPVGKTKSLPEAVRQRFVSRFHRRITNEGELVLSSERFRDQGRNVADCLAKLRTMVETVLTAPKPRKQTKPSRASKQRRLDSKRQTSQKKQGRRPPKLGD